MRVLGGCSPLREERSRLEKGCGVGEESEVVGNAGSPEDVGYAEEGNVRGSGGDGGCFEEAGSLVGVDLD